MLIFSYKWFHLLIKTNSFVFKYIMSITKRFLMQFFECVNVVNIECHIGKEKSTEDAQ